MASIREPPIVLEPLKPPPNSSNGAAFIFLHGLGDEAAGVSNIGEQIQSTGRLGHVRFVFPNALENRDMMSTAWYILTGLSPVPPSRPELVEDEDEDGLLQSVRYVESLISEQEEKHGLTPDRIVVGGFSQGMAVSLLLAMVSEKYCGKLAGIMAVGGYLPVEARIDDLREERGLSHKDADITQICLMRGKADMLIPGRYLTLTKEKLAKHGYKEGDGGKLASKEYQGVGHSINGAMISDICIWLERVLALPQH